MKKTINLVSLTIAFILILSSNTSFASNYTFSKNLTLSSTGTDVVELQNKLESLNFLTMPQGVQKGYFGNLTKVALIKYQKSLGITPAAGYFGQLTRARINTEPLPILKPTTPVPSTYPIYCNPATPPAGCTLTGTASNVKEMYCGMILSCNTTFVDKTVITSISPTSGQVGSKVTITGTGFTSTGNKIKFGNTSSENDPVYNLNSSDGKTLTFNIPFTYYFACLHSNPQCYVATQMVQSGVYPVSVINTNGTSNTINFTVTDGQAVVTQPTISSLSPTSGQIGSAVTITGSGFTSTNNTVNFGTGVIKNITSANGTSVTFTVPDHLRPECSYISETNTQLCPFAYIPLQPGTYPVGVTNANGTSKTAGFTVINASTNSMTPTISLSKSSETVAQGGKITLSWSTQNTPANSAVILILTGASNGAIAQDLPASGSYTWTVPASNCNAAGTACYEVTDSNQVWNTTPGNHQIVAKLYTPKGGWGGGMLRPSPELNIAAVSASSNLVITK